MIKKFLKIFFLVLMLAGIAFTGMLFLLPYNKSPLLIFRYWRYQKLADNFMSLFWENFFSSEILYTGDYVYAGTVAGISVFDARDKKNIRLLKKIRLYGRVGHLSREGNILYATSGASGFFILDISSPSDPKIAGKINLFEHNYVDDGAVKNHIAYLSTDKGIVVVSAQNPRRPYIVRTVPGKFFKWVHLYKDRLYVAQSGIGLAIFDLSQPLNPVLFGKIKLYTPPENKPLPIDPPPRWVTAVGNYVYLANGYQGMSVVNVKNPKNPFLIKHVKAGIFCDAIAVLGNVLAVRFLPNSILFFDISNPENPRLVKSMKGIGFPRMGVNGTLSIFMTHLNGFHIANVRDPVSPKVLGSYEEKPVVWDVKLSDNFVYMASGDAGLKIYKITRNQKPHLIHTVETTGPAVRLEIMKPYVFVANGVAGADVIDARNPAKALLKTSFNIEQRNWSITRNGNLLFFASGTRGLTLYNVQNPLHPAFMAGQGKGLLLKDELVNDYYFNVSTASPYVFLIGFFGNVGLFDVTQKNHFTVVPFRKAMQQVCDVKRKGDFFYLGYNGGIQITTLDNKRALKSIGKHATGGLVMALYSDERFLYAADYKNGIFVFQTNPDGTLKEIARYKTRGKPRDVEVKDGFAYVADSEAGLTVINLATGELL